jgi:hypothetical protein
MVAEPAAPRGRVGPEVGSERGIRRLGRKDSRRR